MTTLLISACGPDVQLTAHHAPAYDARNVTVSVLGVFKNGRMDAAAWGEWAPIVGNAIGDASCRPAFDDSMDATNRELYDLLDEGTKEDGITDEILERVGKSATGDAILVIQAFGRPTRLKPGDAESAAAPSPPPPPPSSPSQRSGRHGRGRSSAPTASETTAAPAPVKFEASLGVYSLKTHEIVASVETRYDSAESGDALNEFSQKLRATLGGMKCAGWAWQHQASIGPPMSRETR